MSITGAGQIAPSNRRGDRISPLSWMSDGCMSGSFEITTSRPNATNDGSRAACFAPPTIAESPARSPHVDRARRITMRSVR